MNTDNQPLVSIIVITYNSSQFVLDTLESAKAQTYQNIELIVTDDCSTDRTVNLCNEWMEKNRERFVRVEVITSPVNTGIAPNCNRGFHAACGEWIKEVAGDDILHERCIEYYLSFAKSNSNIEAITSAIASFTTENKKIKIIESKEEQQAIEKRKQEIAIINNALNTTAQAQCSKVLNGTMNFVLTTLFIKKETFIQVGGFDERIPFIEDIPFIINTLSNNIRIYILPKITVLYRNHASISRPKENQYKNKHFHQSSKLLYKYYQYPSPPSKFIPKIIWKYDRAINNLSLDTILLLGNDRKKILCRFVYYFFKLISPEGWKNKIRHLASKQF